MECLHCRQHLKYKERHDRRCIRCNKEFVFEPRENLIPMTDRRLRAITERVSDNGKLFYTPEQLVLYVSRRSVRRTLDDLPNVLAGIGGLTFVVIIGMATHWVVAVGLLLALAYVAVHALRKQAASRPYVLTRTYVMITAGQRKDFLHDAYTGWPDVYGRQPLGLLSRESPSESWSEPPATIRAVLVCPDRSVLRCLQVNGVTHRLGLALLPTAAPFTVGEQATLEVLRRQPAIPILLLHNASAVGCLLSETVPEMLGITAQHRLVDIGLRPRQVMTQRLMTFHAIQNPNALQRLRERAAWTPEQVSAGPEVRLDEAELKWLEAGNYSPVAALTPKQLIALVTRGVERTARATPQRVAEARAEHQARTLGFLTWPE